MIPLFSFTFRAIAKLPDLKAAMTATYMVDLIIAAFFIVVLLIVAGIIPYERGSVDRSGRKRRTAYFVLGGFVLFGSIATSYFLYLSKIIVPAYATKYVTTMAVAAFIATLLYFALSFLFIKIARKGSKLSTIFPPKR